MKSFAKTAFKFPQGQCLVTLANGGWGVIFSWKKNVFQDALKALFFCVKNLAEHPVIEKEVKTMIAGVR
ncbi:MAG: hypothetical protein AAGG59_19715 [Bacteroidota bacterium]